MWGWSRARKTDFYLFSGIDREWINKWDVGYGEGRRCERPARIRHRRTGVAKPQLRPSPSQPNHTTQPEIRLEAYSLVLRLISHIVPLSPTKSPGLAAPCASQHYPGHIEPLREFRVGLRTLSGHVLISVISAHLKKCAR